MTQSEKYFTGSSLIDLGYRDYIAARFLLNNQFVIQGLTLASTAIEKYLKALIVLNLRENERYHFHFDNLVKLKLLLQKHYYDVTADFDPVFLNILEKSYKIRYYDKLREPIIIGFYLNQFIGELDETIHSLEKSISIPSPYKRAIKSKDVNLYENNFILNNQDKKDFMERSDIAFAIKIQIGPQSHIENTVVGIDIVNKYEGRLSIFTDPFEPKWFTVKREDYLK